MIKTSIIGATGYTGGELVKLLLNHPDVQITSLYAKLEKPSIPIEEEFPTLKGKTDLVCQDFSIDKIPTEADVVFLAVPHTASIELAPILLEKGIKVIDLSADFRLKDPAIYEKWYSKKHSQTKLIEKAVYGLPEIYANQIKKANLIANPGCFPTSTILGIAPAIKYAADNIFINSKTGTSGAGKKALLGLIYSECSNNIKPYKVLNHQHQPEIEQELSFLANKKVDICFVPELAPLDRGILTTIFINLKKQMSTSDLLDIYKKFYKDAPFVEILDEGTFPQLKNVLFSNSCHIGLKSSGKNLIIFSAIDNLQKGAAGQAVQNMNIMFGLPQTTGLK